MGDPESGFPYRGTNGTTDSTTTVPSTSAAAP